MRADRPFVDRPVADLDAANAVARVVAARWGLAEPTLLRRGMNALFATDDAVVRVGMATGPAAASHALATVMTAHGVPTVEPIDGCAADLDGFAATGWRRVVISDAPVDWRAVGAAVRQVHRVPVSAVPSDYPAPSPTSFPWWQFDEMLADVAGELDEPAADGLRAAVDRNREWRTMLADEAVVCHGDVHPGNVLMGPNGPLLIDWDLLCIAPRAWDHAMLTTYAERWGGDTEVYPLFSAGYGSSLGDDPITRAVAELRNVAATLMRVIAARRDPLAAAEAERRLKFWRGESDAPWHAQ